MNVIMMNANIIYLVIAQFILLLVSFKGLGFG